MARFLLAVGFAVAISSSGEAATQQEPDDLAVAVNDYVGCALPEATALEPSGEPLSTIVRAALFACSAKRDAVESVLRARAEVALASNPPGDVDRAVEQLMDSTDTKMTDRLNLDLLRIRAERASEN